LTLDSDRQRAIYNALLRHPGWGDARIADRLGVSASTVARYRKQYGFAPALKQVGEQRRRARLRPVPMTDLLAGFARLAPTAQAR
jgi:hypothetical protein